MRQKSQAPDMVEQFLKESIVQGYSLEGLTVAYLSSDRGTEFFNQRLTSFLEEKGILHQSAPPYTPEYNAIQERMNRTIMEMALSLLFQSDLPLNCWTLAVDTAIYIRNRCPSSANAYFQTPFQILFGEIPDLRHLKVFGSRVFYHIPGQLRNKLEPKALEGTFVGYDQLNRAYRIIPKGTFSRIILSRDVIFDEKTITQKSITSEYLDAKSESILNDILAGEKSIHAKTTETNIYYPGNSTYISIQLYR